jgi:hypothetical protein
MDDLVQWLRAQLDEDERIARAAMDSVGPVLGAGQWRYAESLADEGGQYWSITTVPPSDTAPIVELVGSGMSGGGVHDEAVARHIARHDPARVLREIDAKQQLVERYEFACNEAARLDIDEEERESRVRVAAAFESCVLCLAAVYADRPGYLESWRP